MGPPHSRGSRPLSSSRSTGLVCSSSSSFRWRPCARRPMAGRLRGPGPTLHSLRVGHPSSNNNNSPCSRNRTGRHSSRPRRQARRRLKPRNCKPFSSCSSSAPSSSRSSSASREKAKSALSNSSRSVASLLSVNQRHSADISNHPLAESGNAAATGTDSGWSARRHLEGSL